MCCQRGDDVHPDGRGDAKGERLVCYFFFGPNLLILASLYVYYYLRPVKKRNKFPKLSFYNGVRLKPAPYDLYRVGKSA